MWHKQPWLLVLFGVVLGFSASMLIPTETAQIEQGTTQNQQDSTEKLVQSLQKKLAASEMEVRILNSSKLALQVLTEELQQQVDDQAKDLEFYRRLMAAETDKEGLELNAWSVNQLAEHDYLLRLTFVQYAQQHRMINAKVHVTIQGLQDGQEQQYTIQELLIDGEEPQQTLRFRYFQILEERVVLPAGFIAEKITVEVKAAGKRVEPVMHELIWQVR